MSEKCEGCDNWDGTKYKYGCRVYLFPEKQHDRMGGCAMRTHNKTVKVEAKLSTDSIKVSKRKVGAK